MGGTTSPAQPQLYSTGSTPTSGTGGGLYFGAPGADTSAYGTPSGGGKNVNAPNQVPYANQAAQPISNAYGGMPLNTPITSSNMWNQPGTMTTQGPDMGTPSVANQIQPIPGFSFYNPYNLGSYSYLGQQQSPFGISPYYGGSSLSSKVIP